MTLAIKDIVSKVISDMSGGGFPDKKPNEEQMAVLWKQAAGRQAAFRSRPVSLRKGKLTVMAEDSSMLYYLTLKKNEILESLKGKLADIREIQFRIGETGGKTKEQRRKTKE
ncbi:MAG: DciA family protein [Candidatus Omnitrophica bacterium]|nr:DciA family protein [Candidatus Omnitrophota bacterium]